MAGLLKQQIAGSILCVNETSSPCRVWSETH